MQAPPHSSKSSLGTPSSQHIKESTRIPLASPHFYPQSHWHFINSHHPNSILSHIHFISPSAIRQVCTKSTLDISLPDSSSSHPQRGTNFHTEVPRPPIEPRPPVASAPFPHRALEFLASEELGGAIRGMWRTEADFVKQPMQAYADYRYQDFVPSQTLCSDG